MFTKVSGKPCGFVTLEDFEGSGELALLGDDWLKWQGSLQNEYRVYITAKCQQRFRDSNSYELNFKK